MFSRFSQADITLWAITFICELALLYRLRECCVPVFRCYVVLQVVSTVSLAIISVKGSYAAYFYSYWISIALNVIAEVAVIYEGFARIFEPYDWLPRRIFRRLTFGAFIVLSLAIFALRYLRQDSGVQLLNVIRAADFSINVALFGTVLLIYAVSSVVGMAQMEVLGGLMLLFAIYTVRGFLITEFGSISPIREMNMVGFILACFYWLANSSKMGKMASFSRQSIESLEALAAKIEDYSQQLRGLFATH